MVCFTKSQHYRLPYSSHTSVYLWPFFLFQRCCSAASLHSNSCLLTLFLADPQNHQEWCLQEGEKDKPHEEVYILHSGSVCSSQALTVAAVLQVGPDDVFLREAEHAQPATSHAGIDNHTCVCYQVWTLIKASPDSHMIWKRTDFIKYVCISCVLCVCVCLYLMYPTCGLCWRNQR